MSAPTVAFHTLGCKLNYAETATVARQFDEAGFIQVAFEEKADVYVINSCAVTENAERECRSLIHRALRNNPDAFIAVTGCFAQIKPDRIASIKGVDLVAGAADKFRLAEHIRQAKWNQPQVMACDISSVTEFVPAVSSESRTRAFLKVQDGCNYHCSFCTIPLARGPSRSHSMEGILHQVYQLAEKGVKEVVLSGVNLGDFHYRQHSRSFNFFDLLCRLDAMDVPLRFRISSIEPNLLSDDIIDLVAASSKLVPHFHIPLQSGSDRILKAMRRRYLSRLYALRVTRIKERMPFACIGADVMTGFPGETEADFEMTCQLVDTLSLSYLHVFTYSERDNTHAITLPGRVPPAIRKERTRALRKLSERLTARFHQLNDGRLLHVLFEHTNHQGRMSGYSENYIRVTQPYDPDKVNTITPVIFSASAGCQSPADN
jgi:threonylcarbamoyladenosine tRNA methylthiotransferase MtaB